MGTLAAVICCAVLMFGTLMGIVIGTHLTAMRQHRAAAAEQQHAQPAPLALPAPAATSATVAHVEALAVVDVYRRKVAELEAPRPDIVPAVVLRGDSWPARDGGAIYHYGRREIEP